MKAVVYTGPRRVASVEDWPEPRCGPGDVVVSMRAVGLCGSDLSVYEGHRPVPSLPWVPGHEGGGTVIAVGSEVCDRQVGQRVVVEPNLPCFGCPACRGGVTSACPHRRVLGMNAPGILAERVAIPAQLAWPVPKEWPDELLACFEPLAVARAAIRRSGVGPGQNCLVIGAGSQGLLICLSLLAHGATPYVTDPHEGRVTLAEKLGAQRADLYGEDYPYVFETAGVPSAFATAMGSVAAAGTVTLIGLGSDPVQLSTLEVVRRGLTLVGSIIYDHPRDFADARDAVVEGVGRASLRPDRVVHAGIPPDHAMSAFAEARSAPGKSWIDLTPWRIS